MSVTTTEDDLVVRHKTLRAYGGADPQFMSQSSICFSNISCNTSEMNTDSKSNVENNDNHDMMGGHSNMNLASTDSSNSYPYKCETLDMLMKTINDANSYDIDVIESENMTLRKKLIELEEEEQIEKEKLMREEKRLKKRLFSKRSEVYRMRYLKEHTEESNSSIRGNVDKELKKTQQLRSKLEAERDLYEGSRSKLHDLTLELHDQIRFRTAGIKQTRDIVYRCCGIEIHVPMPDWIWNIRQSPRKRRFYVGMIKNAFYSLEYIFITLTMLFCLAALLYISGAVVFQCQFSYEKSDGSESDPAPEAKEKPKDPKPDEKEGVKKIDDAIAPLTIRSLASIWGHLEALDDPIGLEKSLVEIKLEDDFSSNQFRSITGKKENPFSKIELKHFTPSSDSKEVHKKLDEVLKVKSEKQQEERLVGDLERKIQS